jgi:hypothetical protein
MTNDDGRKPEGAPGRSLKAGAGAPSCVDRNGPKRFSVQRVKQLVVHGDLATLDFSRAISSSRSQDTVKPVKAPSGTLSEAQPIRSTPFDQQ